MAAELDRTTDPVERIQLIRQRRLCLVNIAAAEVARAREARMAKVVTDTPAPMTEAEMRTAAVFDELAAMRSGQRGA